MSSNRTSGSFRPNSYRRVPRWIWSDLPTSGNGFSFFPPEEVVDAKSSRLSCTHGRL